MAAIEPGQMVFLGEGSEGVGAVRSIQAATMSVYVENNGEFELPLSAILKIHDQKIILDKAKLDSRFLKAVGHAHDREDPSVAG